MTKIDFENMQIVICVHMTYIKSNREWKYKQYTQALVPSRERWSQRAQKKQRNTHNTTLKGKTVLWIWFGAVYGAEQFLSLVLYVFRLSIHYFLLSFIWKAGQKLASKRKMCFSANQEQKKNEICIQKNTKQNMNRRKNWK